MNMDGALANARSGLANINHQLNIIANNVANANTPDYSAEIGTQRSMVAGNAGMGVRPDATGRAINLALQQSMYRQDTVVAGLTTETTHLSAIDAALGTPGQNDDLASLTGQLRDAFSGLLGDPSNAARQAGVAVTRNDVAYQVRSAYYDLSYLHQRDALFRQQDTLLTEFVQALMEAEVGAQIGAGRYERSDDRRRGVRGCARRGTGDRRCCARGAGCRIDST